MRRKERKLNQLRRIVLCLLLGTVLLSCAQKGEDSLQTTVDNDLAVKENGCELSFSEVCAASNRGVQCACGAYCDWVELYNEGKEKLSLAGWYLTDDAQKAGVSLEDFSVPASGYVLIPCCACGAYGTVKLGISKAGETLYLTNGGSIVELQVPTIHKNESYAVEEDGTWGYCVEPTPGEANTTVIREKRQWIEASLDGLHINEVNPDEGWVELYNPTERDISLEGLYFSSEETFLCAYKLEGVVEADGYVLLREEDTSVTISRGDRVYLTNGTTGERDSIEIPKSLEKECSVGRNGSGETACFRNPSPKQENGKGYKVGEALPFFEKEGVYISEVSATGEGGDWIELYNGSGSAINLEGWHLSDKTEDPNRWAVSGTLEPGAYMVVEGVSISASGETVYLYDETGSLVDHFTTPALEYGYSCGRLEGDAFTERVLFDKPTPGKSNCNIYYTGYAAQPVLTETGLYQEEPFILTVTSATEGAVIRYTTDGSVPTESSPVFVEGLVIDTSMSFCARAFAEGKLPSKPVYAQYLFETPHTLPVVCLSVAPREFSTLYNVKEREEVTEHGGYCFFYEADGSLGTAFPCGIKAKGRGSLSFPQKSLTLKLRGKYGQKAVSYPFFGEEGLRYYSLCLRNGGQDIDGAIIRDSLISRAAKGLNVDGQASRAVVVYVNGEYYGLYSLNEEMNADYFVTHYGTTKDVMEVISQSHTVKSGSVDAFRALRKEATKVRGNETAYEALCAQLDVEAFTDYVVIQTLTGNSDTMNQKYARSTDGKVVWRPILFDLDFAYAYPNMNTMKQYFKEEGFRPNENSTLRIQNDIYKGLYFSKIWREKFVERFVEIAYGNFDTDRLLQLVEEMAAEIRPEMERQVERWGMHDSVADWEQEIEGLKRNIAARRETALKQLQNMFGLTDEEMKALVEKYGG